MTNLDYSDTRLPDSHYQLLTDTLPSWLGNACADKRQALATTQPQQLPGSAEQRAALARLTGAHWEAQNSVDRALQHLQDAKAFAKPILEQALKADYGLDLNVEATYLRLYIPDRTLGSRYVPAPREPGRFRCSTPPCITLSTRKPWPTPTSRPRPLSRSLRPAGNSTLCRRSNACYRFRHSPACAVTWTWVPATPATSTMSWACPTRLPLRYCA
ncbi:hypothetical protein KFQ04_12415 [Pseudomonas synxantha]|nr:hypothetical protein KFQ04_12415 [Pseudomonas synxantha]